MKVKLSDRVRPNSECAPWVRDEIMDLEARAEKAEAELEKTFKAGCEAGATGFNTIGEDAFNHYDLYWKHYLEEKGE